MKIDILETVFCESDVLVIFLHNDMILVAHLQPSGIIYNCWNINDTTIDHEDEHARCNLIQQHNYRLETQVNTCNHVSTKSKTQLRN